MTLTPRARTRIVPAMRARSVALVVFDGVQGLDVFGPADVFYFANYVAAKGGAETTPYAVELVAARSGPVATASGPRIHADRALSDPALRPDVLLVAGGLTVGEVAADTALVADLRGLLARSGEVGSICTGALLLARTGALDGRRATTHWALADELARANPAVTVEPDRIFVRDGAWTSAGVTAGIDLALQLVRTHHGSEIATGAARHMVVYMQRAGGQGQFSTHLAAQRSSHPTVADLMAYVADHPDADLSIAALAARARMSERSFQRLFAAETGMSPGRFVERSRIDAARMMLEQTEDGLASITARCGFGRQETFLRAFRRVVGVSPTEYRRGFPRHAAPEAGVPPPRGHDW
jgi:transcriptional regulator GlxA family with amidase domain